VTVVAQPHRGCDEVGLEVERAFSDVPMIDRNDTNQKEKKKKRPLARACEREGGSEFGDVAAGHRRENHPQLALVSERG
jgi:hypothetical protein